MNSLEYAIQMEVDGEKYYREQALENKDNDLYQVFTSLAEDEKRHAQIIKERQEGKDTLLAEGSAICVKNVFSDADGVDAEKNRAKQIDAYKLALDMEEKSIELYKKLLSETEEDKDIFEFLIRQEEDHYKVIEEIIKMVTRPDEWVEDAEFGLRQEY
ncbi:MAG: ferritin family protein [Clostridiales bacterium]|nr:ferritin family protein [Clostridiales bacterium]